MHLNNFLLVATLSATALAQEIDSGDDVPAQCLSACAAVIDTGRQCNKSYDEDDAVLDCICAGDGISIEVPKCEACVASYISSNDDVDDDEYDDIGELRSICGFSTATSTAMTSTALPSTAPTVLTQHLSGSGAAGLAVHMGVATAVIALAAVVIL